MLGKIAHELVHYVKLLKDNNSEPDSAAFFGWPHGHCNKIYQKLVGQMGLINWNAYHSIKAVRDIDQMIQRVCWKRGKALNSLTYKGSDNF
ncbi:MAG: hypothetical protein CMF70_04030 [Magnetovibrio sp.]|nr:hypothetical protein [Magnetovibrio sp.]